MTTTNNTPLRDAWLVAKASFDDVDRDATDEQYDALEHAAEAAKAAFLTSGEPHLYEMRDDGGGTGEVSASSMAGALEEAENWAREGDWLESDEPETVWVTVRVRDLATGGEDRTTVTIEPDEPKCEDGEDHDWQAPFEIVGGGTEEKPGVWGHGGGVEIHEVCMRCGCGKLTDTWAQNPSNGEQGLTSVTYTPDEYADELARMGGMRRWAVDWPWVGREDVMNVSVSAKQTK